MRAGLQPETRLVDRGEVEPHAEAETIDVDAATSVLRIVGVLDDYLYTNEHAADGKRRSIFSGPNREN